MSAGRWRAFRGANGWYVAWEGADGFHYQASGTLTEREARREARRKNDEDEGDDE